MTALRYAQECFLSMLSAHTTREGRERGILLAFSGGADSALLLALLMKYNQKEPLPLAALHVHHGIRGEEADRDESFCRDAAARYGIPFYCEHVRVPETAAEEGRGIEETARRLRYDCLLRTAEQNGFAYILTAHHATDNAETVLLNLVRGSGGAGLCGIPPVRPLGKASLVRPLLSLTREQILAACAEEGLSYVSDSTNEDTAYRRNYMREEILPRLRSLNPSLEQTLFRMTQSLSEDMALLTAQAQAAYREAKQENTLAREKLLSLPKPIAFRVLQLFHRDSVPDAPSLERVHVDAILDRMKKEGSFTLSLPGGLSLLVTEERLRFSSEPVSLPLPFDGIPLSMGEARLPDGSRILLLEKDSCGKNANVYKKLIHRELSSATINGGLYVRSRRAGDAYRFGGVTHKLKKLLSDAKIPEHERARLPVLCDESGILWAPPFGVREDGGQKEERDLILVYISSEHVEE